MNKISITSLRMILTFVAAAILVWQVITRSFVAHIANTAPDTALSLRSTDPKALLVLAERRLVHIQRREKSPADSPSETQTTAAPIKEAQDRLRRWAELAFKAVNNEHREIPHVPRPAEPAGFDAQMSEHVRTFAESALANDPLNARALSILGQLAHMVGDEAGVAKFLSAAARRSIRQSAAIYWLMRKSYDSRDYATALYCADVLLRTRSQTSEHVMPILLDMAEHEQANNELRRAVLNNPPWRSNFLAAHARYASDARAPLELLLAMRETSTPPTAVDLRTYLEALIERKQYELAYYAWLQFLPPEHLTGAGFLFNGSFEIAPTGLPFDWIISEGTGVTIDIVQRPDRDGERALFIEFGYGRVEFGGVQQLTALAPGNYEFKAKYTGDIVGKRGLVWRVACADAPGSPIGESPMATGATPSWQDIEFSFIVPSENCRAQYIRLQFDARMASEKLTSGSILYDEIRIARVNARDRP